MNRILFVAAVVGAAALPFLPAAGEPLVVAEDSLGPDRLLEAQVYDAGFDRADANYKCVLYASDGKVYYVLSCHQLDCCGRMYALDPATGQIAELADLGDVVGEKALKTMPQGKAHVNIYEHDGRLYTAIMQGFYRTPEELAAAPELAGYTPYPGGHFIAYDLKSGAFTDLARTAPNEGIITMAMDPARGRLYGLTQPGGFFVYCDLATRRLDDLGPVLAENERVCRSLAVDPRTGDVYWTNVRGRILAFRYERVTIEILTQCSLRDPAFGPPDGWRSIVWYPAEKVFYGVHQRGNRLFRFDPAAGTVEPLESIGADACRQRGPDTHAGECDVSTLAFDLGPDGETLYYLATGPALDTRDGRRLPATVDFVTYHVPSRTYTDHGTLRTADGRYVTLAQSLTVGGGSVYSVAWIDVPPSLPDHFARMKAAKEAVLPPDQPVTEVNLIRFPDPAARAAQ